MKLTRKNLLQLKKSLTPLEKRACNYVLDNWGNYDDKKHIFTDVLNYGCQSGTVGFLIYYSDTVPFYKKHKDEINNMLYTFLQECGVNSPKDLFGNKWDEEDPLCLDVYNQNLMAWFGFEESLRNVGRNFEILENYI